MGLDHVGGRQQVRTLFGQPHSASDGLKESIPRVMVAQKEMMAFVLSKTFVAMTHVCLLSPLKSEGPV